MGGVEGLFFLLVLIVSVVLHEVAHGYAAYALGDATPAYAGRLTMNPLVHIDPIGSVLLPLVLIVSGSPFLFGWARPVPYNPQNLRASWGEAFVAFAGPATNLVLAVCFALIARVAASLFQNASIVAFAEQAVVINIVLALFNLIPVPPLDGSKVLAYFLPPAGRRWMATLETSLASWGVAGLAAVLLLLILVTGEWFSAVVYWVVRFLTGSS